MLTTVTVTMYNCVCEACGYHWRSPVVPPRCSSCKSRTWNQDGGPVRPTLADYGITNQQADEWGPDRLWEELSKRKLKHDQESMEPNGTTVPDGEREARLAEHARKLHSSFDRYQAACERAREADSEILNLAASLTPEARAELDPADLIELDRALAIIASHNREDGGTPVPPDPANS